MKRNEGGLLVLANEDIQVVTQLIQHHLSIFKDCNAFVNFASPEDIQRYVDAKIRDLLYMFYPKELFGQLDITYDGETQNIHIDCKMVEGAVIIEEANNRVALEFSTYLNIEGTTGGN